MLDCRLFDECALRERLPQVFYVWAEIKGDQIALGDIKSRSAIKSSVKGGETSAMGATTFRDSSHIAKQLEHERAIVDQARQSNATIVIEYREPSTGRYISKDVLRTINIQFGGWAWRRRQSERKDVAKGAAPVPSETNSTEESVKGPRGRALLRWTAILGSLVALVLLVYAYVVVFVTGIHFVAVASAPDKASAIREIQSLNRFFKEEGHTDLEARTRASRATGIGWYMISIGGPHTSREAAEATFRKAKQALGPRMRSDAYIYSTENTSPVRVIRNWVRGILRWFVE